MFQDGSTNVSSVSYQSRNADRGSPSVPPRLVISGPVDDTTNESQLSAIRYPTRGVGSRRRRHSKPSEWVDVDDSPQRRRKAGRRSSRHQSKRKKSNDLPRDYRGVDNGLGRFFPNLSRITEVTESTSSRPSTRGSNRQRRREKDPARRIHGREEASSVHRRPVKHRTGGIHRRGEGLRKINPSLLSVLSTLTGASDLSSGSGSTITQQTYDQRSSDSSERGSPAGSPRRPVSEVDVRMSSKSPPTLPSVFDYMDEPNGDDDHDTRSVASSSSSSHYQPSDASSSELPGTPSSRSTFPSPTTTRSQSVSELRQKYDPQYATSTTSVRSSSRSPDFSNRSLRKAPSVSSVPEDEESPPEASTLPKLDFNPRQRSSSRSSHKPGRSSNRLKYQEEEMRQHMASLQQDHYVEPVYGQHRSYSNSSLHSDQSAYACRMAMQPYQWPPPQAPMAPPAPTEAMNGHVAVQDQTAASAVPDASQRTVTGYEKLALELSSSESSVKPLYRKFEYLNHRILLHLQDELCELEEQLRALDEVIAQMDPGTPDGQKRPPSRRGESFHGNEAHMQRIQLLGRIFIKTEQYNKAMSAYGNMVKDSSPPGVEQVSAYRQWMSKHAPVHEVETRFLRRIGDLIVPGARRNQSNAKDPYWNQVALATLVFPLFLYSYVPSFAGRLVFTIVAAFFAAEMTEIRQLMPVREWAAVGAAYVLGMAVLAGCIP